MEQVTMQPINRTIEISKDCFNRFLSIDYISGYLKICNIIH
jgi:hypothetical protein